MNLFRIYTFLNYNAFVTYKTLIYIKNFKISDIPTRRLTNTQTYQHTHVSCIYISDVTFLWFLLASVQIPQFKMCTIIIPHLCRHKN